MPPNTNLDTSSDNLLVGNSSRALLVALEDLRDSLTVRLDELSGAIDRLRIQASELDRSLEGRRRSPDQEDQRRLPGMSEAQILDVVEFIPAGGWSSLIGPPAMNLRLDLPAADGARGENGHANPGPTNETPEDIIGRRAARRAERIRQVRAAAGLPESELINEDARAGLIPPLPESSRTAVPHLESHPVARGLSRSRSSRGSTPARRGLPPTNTGSQFANQPKPVIVKMDPSLLPVSSPSPDPEQIAPTSTRPLSRHGYPIIIDPSPGPSGMFLSDSEFFSRATAVRRVRTPEPTQPEIDTSSLTYRGIGVANRLGQNIPYPNANASDRWHRSWLLNRANAINANVNTAENPTPPPPPSGPANMQEARRISQRRWPNGSPMEEEARESDENQQLRQLQRQMDVLRRNLNLLERRSEALSSSPSSGTLFARLAERHGQVGVHANGESQTPIMTPDHIAAERMARRREAIASGNRPPRLPSNNTSTVSTSVAERIADRIIPPSRQAVTVINTRRRNGPLRDGERYLRDVEPDHSILVDYPEATIRIISDPSANQSSVPGPRPVIPIDVPPTAPIGQIPAERTAQLNERLSRAVDNARRWRSEVMESTTHDSQVNDDSDTALSGIADRLAEMATLRATIREDERQAEIHDAQRETTQRNILARRERIGHLLTESGNLPERDVAAETEAEETMMQELRNLVDNDNTPPEVRGTIVSVMGDLESLDRRAAQRRAISDEIVQRASESMTRARRLLADIDEREAQQPNILDGLVAGLGDEGPTVSSPVTAATGVIGTIEIREVQLNEDGSIDESVGDVVEVSLEAVLRAEETVYEGSGERGLGMRASRSSEDSSETVTATPTAESSPSPSSTDEPETFEPVAEPASPTPALDRRRPRVYRSMIDL